MGRGGQTLLGKQDDMTILLRRGLLAAALALAAAGLSVWWFNRIL